MHGRRIFVAKHSFNKTVWQCLTLISQFGIMMLVPTGMMFALGYWLDGRLGKFIRRRTKRTGNEKFFQKDR